MGRLNQLGWVPPRRNPPPRLSRFYYGFDLGYSKVVGALDVQNIPGTFYEIRDFQIQYSQNNLTWTQVGSYVGPQRVEFGPALVARYVRLVIGGKSDAVLGGKFAIFTCAGNSACLATGIPVGSCLGPTVSPTVSPTVAVDWPVECQDSPVFTNAAGEACGAAPCGDLERYYCPYSCGSCSSCQDDPSFQSRYGGCPSYAAGELNHVGCETDTAKYNRWYPAAAACSISCGTCPPRPCPEGVSDSSTWHVVVPGLGRVGCSGYSPTAPNSQFEYCSTDQDAEGILAEVACTCSCGTY